jgi:WhiB family redox-sensing transcriptional regulator
MSITSEGLLQRLRDSAGTDWRDYAACRDVDPDLFFPLGTVGASLPQIEHAKQVCGTCPVSKTCLRWALDHGDAGVWGGTTDEERRRRRRSRALGESGSTENSCRFPAFTSVYPQKSWSSAWLQLAGIRLVRLSGGVNGRWQG